MPKGPHIITSSISKFYKFLDFNMTLKSILVITLLNRFAIILVVEIYLRATSPCAIISRIVISYVNEFGSTMFFGILNICRGIIVKYYYGIICMNHQFRR